MDNKQKNKKVTNITESPSYNWDEYYLSGARELSSTRPFHIDVTISAKKRNDRRALNLDIYTQPGSPPLKYISHMVPYARKYELFTGLSDQQLKWNNWDLIKSQYTEHKDQDVQYGKCQHRTKHTKVLERRTVPHCVAGMYFIADQFIAHILLFDKEYFINCDYDLLSDKGKQFYIARGFHTETLNPPELEL